MSIGQLSKASQKSRVQIKNTRTDSKFQSTKSLFFTSARVGDAATILAEYDQLARSNTTSKTKLRKEWIGVSSLVLPFLSKASKEISSSARVLAPMPDIQTLQTQGDSDLKRELACDPKYKTYATTSERLICHHLRGQGDGNDENTPPAKRVCVEPRPRVHPAKNRLLPESNKAFNKAQVVQMVHTKTKYKTTERKDLILAIVAHQAEYGVLSSYRGISRLVEGYEKTSKLPFGEFKMGRPPYAYAADIISIADNCNSELGRTINKSDIGDHIQKVHDERRRSAGIQPLTETIISERTKGRYFVRVADQSNMSIAEKVIPKTTTRDAAERSLRAAAATAGVIGATHLLPVERLDNNMIKEMKNLPEDVRMMMEMVSDVFGCPVYAVRPEYIFSSDETTQYTYEGTRTKADQFVLTSKDSIAKRATNSLFRVKMISL